MKIKARHVKMARAAFRNGGRHLYMTRKGPQIIGYIIGDFDSQIRAITSWHRAAKGKYQ